MATRRQPQRRDLAAYACAGTWASARALKSWNTRRISPSAQPVTELVEVEPLRLVHLHSDWGPTDSRFRFEADGEATRLVVDSD